MKFFELLFLPSFLLSILWALACAAPAAEEPSSAFLEEDLAFVENTIAGRLRMHDFARKALLMLARRHPGGALRVTLAEARLMTMEALEPESAARREALLADVRARLAAAATPPASAAPPSSVPAEAALALARLDLDVAEAHRTDAAFAKAARMLETLVADLDKLVEKAKTALDAKVIDEAAFLALDQRLYQLQAESRYEWAKAHLSWGRLRDLSPERKKEILEKGAEEFDNAALLTEDENRPDVVYYPAPYLGKAACERALGDVARARTTLMAFLAKKIQHQEGARARRAALEELADMSLAAQDWDGARKTAAEIRKEGDADGAALMEARAAVEAALAAQEKDPQWRKSFEAGIARLEELGVRNASASREAAAWVLRYRAASGASSTGTPKGGPDLLAQADERLKQSPPDYEGALALYRQILFGAEKAGAWDAQIPRVWDRCGFCHFKLGRFAAAGAAWAQVAEHGSVDEKTGVEAAEKANAIVAKWFVEGLAAPPAQGEALAALHQRSTAAIKESVTGKFPNHEKTQPFLMDLARLAREMGDLPRALAVYARVRPSVPVLYGEALVQIVELQRGILSGVLKAAGGRFPTKEETAPLDEAHQNFAQWLAGPRAGALDVAARRALSARAVSGAAYFLALAAPDRALAILDDHGKNFPDAKPPEEWVLFRCIAEARRGDLPQAKKIWAALGIQQSKEKEPSKPLLAGAAVLGRIAAEAAREAKRCGDEGVAREAALWGTELLTFTLGGKENPSPREIEELVNRFEWQVAKTQEYLTAIGIGELILAKADAWKIAADTRLRVLGRLSDAYWGVEDWERALAVSQEIDAAYRAREQFARWARERVASSARRLAEKEPDAARRKSFCEQWYEACRSLREATPVGEAVWWDYSYEMGLALVVQNEPGVLRDTLAQLFGAAPDLGGSVSRRRFVDLAVWTHRRGSEQQKKFSERLLGDMWVRGESSRDPLAARLIR